MVAISDLADNGDSDIPLLADFEEASNLAWFDNCAHALL